MLPYVWNCQYCSAKGWTNVDYCNIFDLVSVLWQYKYIKIELLFYIKLGSEWCQCCYLFASFHRTLLLTNTGATCTMILAPQGFEWQFSSCKEKLITERKTYCNQPLVTKLVKWVSNFVAAFLPFPLLKEAKIWVLPCVIYLYWWHKITLFNRFSCNKLKFIFPVVRFKAWTLFFFYHLNY